jgi:hypothetical protein
MGQAARKLGRSALPNRQFWTLKLVQAAVASGAARVDVTSKTGHFLTVAWNTESVTWDNLLDLESSILPGPAEQRSLHHLALALTALRSLRVRSVSLSFTGGTDPPQQSSIFGGLRLSRQPGDRQRLARIEVRVEFSLLRRLGGSSLAAVSRTLPLVIAVGLCIGARSGAPFAMARKLKPYVDPEIKHLHSRAAHAPIPVVINGEVINRTAGAARKLVPLQYTLLDSQTGTHLAATALKSPAKRAFYQRVVMVDGEPDFESLTDLTDPRLRASGLLFHSERSLTAFATLVRSTSGLGSQLQFVLDGVVVCSDFKALPNGWSGVVSSRGLTTDLSGFGLVRDQAYLDRVELLKERIRWTEAQPR